MALPPHLDTREVERGLPMRLGVKHLHHKQAVQGFTLDQTNLIGPVRFVVGLYQGR